MAPKAEQGLFGVENAIGEEKNKNYVKLGAYCHYDTVKGKLKEGIGVMGKVTIVHMPSSLEFYKDYDKAVEDISICREECKNKLFCYYCQLDEAIEDLNSCLEKRRDMLSNHFIPNVVDGFGFNEISLALAHYVFEFDPGGRRIYIGVQSEAVMARDNVCGDELDFRGLGRLKVEPQFSVRASEGLVPNCVGMAVEACTVVELIFKYKEV